MNNQMNEESESERTASFRSRTIKEVRVLFEDPSGTWRKITKIVPYKIPDGGFAIMLPYHRARQGYLFKLQVSDSISGAILTKSKIVDEYTASERIKLSFHSNGFTQFSSVSGNTILSGLDQKTGKIKGLGIMAKPFSTPVWSGSAFWIGIWGLDSFEKATPGLKDICFTSADLSRRGILSNQTNCVFLQGYLVKPNLLRVHGKFPDIRCVENLWDQAYGKKMPKQLRVIALHSNEVVLMIEAYRFRGSYPTPSGYIMCSPRDAHDHSINAIYPRRVLRTVSKSLDYKLAAGLSTL